MPQVFRIQAFRKSGATAYSESLQSRGLSPTFEHDGKFLNLETVDAQAVCRVGSRVATEEVLLPNVSCST